MSSRAHAATGINKQINFQGKVTNTNGTNVADASYTFLFCLYTTASPAVACTSGANNDAVWRESKSITVTDGIFQTNLGDTTTFPGSVDFNTDNIYLGVNFNANGQMAPLVRFTAAPYAMNADKIHGLTVTDTTGTLTIPNGKTIQFSDAFTTTGVFPLTLTATASTTATLPSGTITLADLATGQTLTNKIIGSTGLTFTGATTDITTGTNESLVIMANGTGVVDIQNATTVDSLTVDTGGISIAAGQSYTGAGAVTLSSGAASDLTLNSGTTGTINIGTDASAETINIGNTGAAVKSILIGNNTQANTITIGDATASSVSITDNNWSIGVGGAATFTSVGAGSGTITTSGTIGTAATTTFTGAGATFSSAIAANGGITFDASTDTIGAFTAGGTIDMSTQILTNIGNTGTDFVASTGALTLAGILTANGGISLTGGQSLTAGALSFMDLGLIVHNSTSPQGLRLPQAASATPSNPTSGEGYLAWDTAGNQLITYNGAAWTAVGGGGPIALNDLTDVVTSTPAVDQTLRYNGTNWVNGPIGNTSAGSGVSLFYSNSASGISTYETVSQTPDSSAEQDETIVVNNNTQAFENYSTTAALGRTSIDAGVWNFNTYAYVSATTGTTTLTFNVYKRASGGGETLLFSVTTPDINNTSAGLITASSVQPAYAILATDLLVVKLDATTDNVGSITAHFVHSGASHYSNIETPLVTSHDNLAGLQGGTSNEFYHLTSAEYTGSGTGTFARVSSPVFTTPNIGSATGSVSGSAATVTGAAQTLITSVGTLTGLTMGGTLATSTQDITGTNFTITGSTGVIALKGGTAAGDLTTMSTAAGTSLNILPSNPSSTGAGVGLVLKGSAGTTTGAGGAVTITAGAAAGAGTTGGTIGITTGAGGASGTAPSGGLTILTGNAASGTAGNVSIDVGTSSTGNGTIGIGTAARSQTINIGNNATAGTVTTIGSLTNTGLILQDAQWNVTDAGAATFTSVGAGSGTITTSGTIGTAATTTFTGAGATFSSTIAANGGITFDASTDTVGAHTLGGTLDASTQIITNIGNAGTDFVASTGALTLAGVLTANGGVTVAGGQNLSMSSGVGTFTQTNAQTTDATADAHTITLSAGGTGSTGALRGFVISQSDTATTGVFDTLAYIENLKTPETTTNGLLITNNAASGTLSNALHITNTAGTLTSAITIDGTAPGTYILDTGSLDISGAGAISGATGVSTTTVTASSAIAANGGITFDASTDTVGAHTLGGTIDASTQIITNIGNAGTDFVASTGALTLAGILTANGGISIGTQALTGTTGIIDYTNFDVDATGSITVSPSKGLDTNAAGVLQLGKTNATSVDLCNSANCDTIGIGNLATTDADTITIGDVLDTTAINSTGWSVSGAGALTMAGAIAANGGITFDNTTDTVGAHTLGGTVDASTQIITNIGNAGTDFVASTGALTLAGILTANGGISLTGGQSLTAGALAYIDLALVVHNTTALQGFRLPQAASATPSSPVSGEGFLAWDAAGNQLITYNGTSWATVGGGVSPFGSSGGVITKTAVTDFLSLRYGDAADTQLQIENTTAGTVPTADVMQIDATGGTTGIVTTGVDVLGISWEAGHMSAGGTINGINLALTPISASTTSADIFNGLNIANITGVTAAENAIALGTGWDNYISATNFTVTGAGNLDVQGTLQAGSGNITLTVAAGTLDASTALTLTSGDGAGGTSSGSGLEVGNTSAIGLLQGCLDGQVLKWVEATSVWTCTTPSAGGAGDAGYGVEAVNVFTGNGTWTKQSYINNVYVEVWGAGAGGLTANQNNSMGGGGGGGYSAGITSVSGNSTVVVGAGPAVNTNGTASTFTGGVTLTGNGGTRPTTVTGGAGGTATGGTINLPGRKGGNGTAQDAGRSGDGGSSPMGGSGGAGRGGSNVANSNGTAFNADAGIVPGGGGGGGAECNGTGAAGAAGMVIVWGLSGTNGSDLAEVYETKAGVEPGDVVSMSPDSMNYNSEWGLQNISVLEKAKPESRVVGVVSTAAAVTMGRKINETAKHPQPIALAGRTPVKVSLENGPIKTGDLLGPSSIPGVAAKSEKAGMIIGAALEDYNPPPDGSIGKVMIFVHTEYSSGARTNALLERAGFDPGNIPAEMDIGRIMLAQALVEKKNITKETPLSEIFTDRVVAGLEIVSPRVVTDTLVTSAIEPVDKNVKMKLEDGGQFTLERVATGTLSATFGAPTEEMGTPVMSVDANGNATFAGTVTAKTMHAETVEGLEFIQTDIQNAQNGVENNAAEVNNLGQTVAQLKMVLQSLQEKTALLESGSFKDLALTGGLVVNGPAEFRGETTFASFVQFINKVVFHKDVEFAGQVLFNQDTAGYALVKEGQGDVVVTFEKEYAVVPVVNVSLSLQQIDDAEVRKAREELLLVSDVKFIITHVTTKGFEIRIADTARTDIPFSWQAIAVKDAKTSDVSSGSENVDTAAAVSTDTSVPPEPSLPADETPPPVESPALVPPTEVVVPPPTDSASPDTQSLSTGLPPSSGGV